MKKNIECNYNLNYFSNKFPTYMKTPVQKTINLFSQSKEMENKMVKSDRPSRKISEKSPMNKQNKQTNKIIFSTPNKLKIETPILEVQKKTNSVFKSSKMTGKITTNKIDQSNKTSKNVKKINTKENLNINVNHEKANNKVNRNFSEPEFIKNKYRNIVGRSANDIVNQFKR